MKKNAVPGAIEAVSQINAFQKDRVDRMMKTMNEAFSEKNLMKMFCTEKFADKPLSCGFSEFLDITENMLKEMMEISRVNISVQPDYAKDSFAFFKEDMSETPAQIMNKLLKIFPEGITKLYKDKINIVLDKLAFYNTAAIEFLYYNFIPLEKTTQMILEDIRSLPEQVGDRRDTHKICQNWLKILEDEYQAMFNTDCYKNLLSKIFTAIEEYRSAARKMSLELIQLAELPFGCVDENFFEFEKFEEHEKGYLAI